MTIDPLRNSDGRNKSMLGYRLFFVDEQGAIEARLEFFCADDGEAVVMAELIFDACSDCHSGYELWQERRRVLSPVMQHTTKQRPTIAQLSREMQEHLLEIEEQLQKSKWRVATSGRLLEQVDMLRAQLRSPQHDAEAQES